MDHHSPYATSWDQDNGNAWPESTMAPVSLLDTFGWLNVLETPQLGHDFAAVPSSPSEAPDDAIYTPVTPLSTPEGPYIFPPLHLDLSLASPFQPHPPHSVVGREDHHQPQTCVPSILSFPATPSSIVHSLSDHEPIPSPAEPTSPFPFPRQSPEAKKSRRRRSATSQRVFQCDFAGCNVSFTSSRRDIERHKASVHGPPIVLACGESLSFRPDNISRHRKKCTSCMAAHLKKCEEEGPDSKPRPGRKRKAVA